MDTRTRIIDAATAVFRRKGYEGAGLSEILRLSAAPKGSLYHHFPAGKADLAAAAADRASGQMEAFIERCFTETDDWREAVATMCHRLAKQFEIADATEGCPVAATLLSGTPDTARRARASEIYARWDGLTTAHLQRLGHAQPEAVARLLMTLLQGAWVMAQAAGNGDPIRNIPSRLAELP